MKRAMGALAFLIACSGGTDGTVGPTPVATSIVLTPARDTLRSIGATRALTARVTDQSGNQLTGTAVSWTSSDIRIIEVSPAGVATAKGYGSAIISAASGTARGDAALFVDLGLTNITMQSGQVTGNKTSSQAKVTLALSNIGNPGFFKLQFWGLPTSPNGPDTFYGETEIYNIDAGWSETQTWNVNRSGTVFLKYVTVLSRGNGVTDFRETARFTAP